jgi:DNA excision repair protein ERCC-4
MDRMTITADVRELRSGVPDALVALDVHVELATLAVGDYDVGCRVVERKSVDDLHRSLCGERFWGQVAALRRDPRRAYLLVEGHTLEQGPVTPRALRGAMLKVIDNGIRLVQTASSNDTALWLHVLGRQESRRRAGRVYGRVGRRPLAVSPAALLAQIPGVSLENARALLTRFGSVAAVAAASEAELRTLDGIGSQRARAIRLTLTQAS